MGAPEQNEHDPLIGTTFADRYIVTGRLGKGGMAVVYKATDKNLGREVALKVLRRDIASDPVAAKRLIREARAAAALHHPHIITIHDVGERDGTVYVVMEILVGRPLSDVVEERGPLGVVRSLTIAEQLASALVVAHGQNIIHRDIKPENLFLLDAGGGDFVKVLDFSIAKLPTEMVTAALTRQGSVFGTPHYMAPEQVESKAVSPQTDLYALGAVLHEMLAGDAPFDGPSVIDILLKHVKTPPPSLSGLGIRLPAGLSDFVQRLLAKKAADRPASASVVRDELAKFLADARVESVASDPARAGEVPTSAVAADVLSAVGAAAQRAAAVPPAVGPGPVAVAAAPAVATAPVAPSASAGPEAATLAVDTSAFAASAAAAASGAAARSRPVSGKVALVPSAHAATRQDLPTDLAAPDDLPAAPPPDLPGGPQASDKRRFVGFADHDQPEQRTLVGVGLGRMVAEIAKQRAASGGHVAPSADALPRAADPLPEPATIAVQFAAIPTAPTAAVRDLGTEVITTVEAPGAVMSHTSRPTAAPRQPPPPPPGHAAGHTRRPPARIASATADDRVPTQPSLDREGPAHHPPAATVQLVETKVVHASRISSGVPQQPAGRSMTMVWIVVAVAAAIAVGAAVAWFFLDR